MLSEEEKEAIERLEKRIKDNEDYKTTQVWLTDDIAAVDTVLNLITKLQKENKYIHKELDKQQTTINNYAKENEEKNKQIDLMAEYIDGDDTSLANYLYRKNGKCNKKMIKQYFERKVEE